MYRTSEKFHHLLMKCSCVMNHPVTENQISNKTLFGAPLEPKKNSVAVCNHDWYLFQIIHVLKTNCCNVSALPKTLEAAHFVKWNKRQNNSDETLTRKRSFMNDKWNVPIGGQVKWLVSSPFLINKSYELITLI